jgi:hypothetical protein
MEQLAAVLEWYAAHSDEIDEILRKRREEYERGVAEAAQTR